MSTTHRTREALAELLSETLDWDWAPAPAEGVPSGRDECGQVADAILASPWLAALRRAWEQPIRELGEEMSRDRRGPAPTNLYNEGYREGHGDARAEIGRRLLAMLSAPVQAAEPHEDDQRPVDLNAIAEHFTDLVDQIGEVGIWGDYGAPAAPVSYVVQTVLDNATAIENRTGVYAEEVGGDDD